MGKELTSENRSIVSSHNFRTAGKTTDSHSESLGLYRMIILVVSATASATSALVTCRICHHAIIVGKKV